MFYIFTMLDEDPDSPSFGERFIIQTQNKRFAELTEAGDLQSHKVRILSYEKSISGLEVPTAATTIGPAFSWIINSTNSGSPLQTSFLSDGPETARSNT
jgi:hypothetical protein